LTVAGGQVLTHNFAVTTAVGDLKVQDLFAFPNPFDAFGTRFSFALLGSDPADVKIDIYTVSGRRLNTLLHPDLSPGYHQLAWDGNDAEGSALANGVYLYRLSAVTVGGKHVEQLGRLVKLRKPRRVEVETTP
jgi:flagellar hook assembly protein FlgD